MGGTGRAASIIAPMNSLPTEVYAAAQVRAMERHAIEVAGIPGRELMERAGAAALAALARHWPAAQRILVVCGAGNNAGDGYVVARLARAAGLDVDVRALVDPGRLAGDAALAHADFAAAGVRSAPYARESLARADVVVDALLGTGIDRPVAGAMLDCIAGINASGRPVLAVDLPSGLDADSGLVRGLAVAATRTITFVGLKAGLFLGAAWDHVGALEFAGLGVPDTARQALSPVLRRIDTELLASLLPPRRRSAHKGQHGRVLVVGGFAMPGAARLAGEAALRCGAGIVTVATSAEHIAPIVAGRPELIGSTVNSAAALERLLAAADAVAIGPGLGRGRRARRIHDAVVASARPLVLDADALTLLAEQPRQRNDWILTPHPGEAARLLSADTAAVQRDRLGSAQEIARRYGGVCVLKGAGTLVAAGHAPPWVCDRGNPGMATAGSGDVLTGIIAALLAAGCAPEQAAAGGVLVHARAGDRAALAGERGLIAGDLIAELRHCVNPPWS